MIPQKYVMPFKSWIKEYVTLLKIIEKRIFYDCFFFFTILENNVTHFKIPEKEYAMDFKIPEKEYAMNFKIPEKEYAMNFKIPEKKNTLRILKNRKNEYLKEIMFKKCPYFLNAITLACLPKVFDVPR